MNGDVGSSNPDRLSGREHLREMISLARTAAADARSRVGGRSLGNAATGLPSDSVAGYELLSELHRGGQGVVYQGVQKSTNRTVAIKVLREGPFAGQRERIRFEREAGILARLDHPNIVGILDFASSAGGNFIVMDYIAGSPLDRFARERGLTIADRLRLFVLVCEAVSAAHQRGVIHRDLKPGNILVDESGQPRILDFGLAKSPEDSGFDHTAYTTTGQFIGSLPWTSPEQARGQHDLVDVRSDVYSLGVVLYQLITDRFPYPTVGELGQVLRHIQETEAARPRSISRAIDDDLEAIVLKCLSKDPVRRYQSAGELARDIGHYLNQEPIEAKRDSAWYVLRKTLRRYRVQAGVAAAFLLIIFASAIGLSVLYARSRTEAAKARQTAQFVQGILGGIDPATAGDLDKKLMRQVLDDAAKRIDTELAESPEVEASIRQTIGKAYQAMGEYAGAQKHLERAVELRRVILGADHPETLSAMDSLAMLYWENGHYIEGETLSRTVLDFRLRTLGREHEDTLLSMAILAEILHSLGKYDESESLTRETIELRSRVLGPEHSETLSSKNNLATILADLGRLDEAVTIFKEVISAEKRVKGESDPHTLRTMGNLAMIYQKGGRLKEAEAGHREVLELRSRVLGESHPDTITARFALGIILRDRGELDQAETMFRKLIESAKQSMGPKHPDITRYLVSLASMLGRKNEYAEAEQVLLEAVAINAAAYQPDHAECIKTNLALGACISKLGPGRFQEAEKLLVDNLKASEGRADVPLSWRMTSIDRLISLYEAWDAAEPGTGKAELAAHWRATTQPATTSATAG